MEVFVGVRRIKDVRLGRDRPKAVYLGNIKIWPTEVEVYLRVTPDVVWLNEGNSFSATINVDSNTEWIIE